MQCDLVDRWIAVIKPFSLSDVKGRYIEAYSKQTAIPQYLKDKIIAAVNSVSEADVNAAIKMFAEENFSEGALLPAVEFFESRAGQEYLRQRDIVMGSCMSIIGKLMGDAANSAGI